MRSGHGRWTSERGQASVETVALLPAYCALALVMGQAAAAGYTAWTATGAARIGARAQALGQRPGAAVRGELPALLRRGAAVAVAGGAGEGSGRVTVRLRIPSLLPGVSIGTVRGQAQLPSQVEV